MKNEWFDELNNEHDEGYEYEYCLDDFEFSEFAKQMIHDLDEWVRVPKVRIINPVKYNQFKDIYIKLAILLRKSNPFSTISYKMNDALDAGCVSITLVSHDLIIVDNVGGVAKLCKAIVGQD